MDVSGRKGDEPPPSATVRRILCNACTYNDESNDAGGFCENCKEYLCPACISHHKSFRMSRSHVIIDKVNMPLDDTEQSSILCTEPCDQHTDKFVEYYCQTHDTMCCGVCTTVNHRTCKVDYIPDIAKTFKDSSEYKQFIESIKELVAMAGECRDQILSNFNNIEEFHSRAIADIQKFRAEINTYLDKREAELMGIARKIKENNRHLMETLKEESQKIQQEITDTKTTLDETIENLAQLFLTCKRTKSKIDSLQKECASMVSQTKMKKVNFKPNNEIVWLMRSTTPLGKLEDNTVFSKTEISKDYEISVRTSNDIKFNTSLITGIALLSKDKILIADRSKNKCLKIVDTRNKKVSSKLRLSSGHLEVTYLPDSQAAATLPDERMVQIVSTSAQLEPIRHFKTNGTCRDICFHDGQLIVTNENSANVEIFNIHGVTLKVVTSDKVFKSPCCAILANMQSSHVIYVTDYNKSTMSMVTKDGEIVHHHTMSGLFRLDSVIDVMDDQIAVCDGQNREIQVLGDDGNGLKKVCEWRLERNLLAIEVCPLNQVLFVSSTNHNESDYICVYRISQLM